MKKVSDNQFNLFGGVGAVRQTEVMATSAEKRFFHEGAYLTCEGCGTKSRVVYIPIQEVPHDQWKDWVKKQVDWEEDCPSCEDRRRYIERQRSAVAL